MELLVDLLHEVYSGRLMLEDRSVMLLNSYALSDPYWFVSNRKGRWILRAERNHWVATWDLAALMTVCGSIPAEAA